MFREMRRKRQQLTPEEDRALAMTPTDKLLDLVILQPENIVNTLHAYQLAKRCTELAAFGAAAHAGGQLLFISISVPLSSGICSSAFFKRASPI